MTIRNILIISEQRGDFTTLTAALERADPERYAISTVSTLEQPVEALMDRDNDAVILAHSLETEYLLRLAQKARLPTPIVVLVDLESETLINKLKDAGASDYLVRGMLTDDLIHRVLDYSIALKGATRVVDTRIAREPAAEMMPRGQTGSARVSQLHQAPAEVEPSRERSPVVIAADMLSKKQREDTAADGPDDLGLDPELDPGPGYEREEELEPDLALRLDPGPDLDSDLDSGFELDGELNLESGLELGADPGMGSALDLDSDLGMESALDLDSDLGMESALDLDSDLGMESALDLEAGLGTQSSHDLESDPYRDSGPSRDANLNLDTNLDLDAAFAAGAGFELDATPAQEAEPAGGFAAGSEVEVESKEVESELEMDSGLTLEPYEEESDGIDFESVEDFHPDFDDELDLADADLELEPISAEDAQDPDAPDGADVLAGPIAEALEALRAGAPTAPLAQEPLPPGPPPSNPTAAQAQIRASKSPARNGPVIALVCILLVVVGMLAAGMFRLNDTLMGLEQRIAGEGSVVRGVQQPKMGEELWVEMRQRNEQLAGQVEALQTRLSDQTVTDAATAGQKLPETEDGVAVTSPAADAFGPDSPVPDVFREEAAVADIATTEESTLPAQTVPLPPLVQSNSPGWFINMGSFGSYEAAGQWAATLDPGSYAVEVSAISRDGKDLYRVRVVGIEDRLAARSLAQRFQQELYLNQLWVGKD